MKQPDLFSSVVEDILHGYPVVKALYVLTLAAFSLALVWRWHPVCLLAPCAVGAVSMCVHVHLLADNVRQACGGLIPENVVLGLTSVPHPFYFGCLLSACAVGVRGLFLVWRRLLPFLRGPLRPLR